MQINHSIKKHGIMVFLLFLFYADSYAQGFLVETICYKYAYDHDTIRSRDTISEKYDASKRLIYRIHNSRLEDGLRAYQYTSLDSTKFRLVRHARKINDTSKHLIEIVTKDSVTKIYFSKNDTISVIVDYCKKGRKYKSIERTQDKNQITTLFKNGFFLRREIRSSNDSSRIGEFRLNKISGYYSIFYYNVYLKERFKGYRKKSVKRSGKYTTMSKVYHHMTNNSYYLQTWTIEKYRIYKTDKKKILIKIWERFNDKTYRLAEQTTLKFD